MPNDYRDKWRRFKRLKKLGIFWWLGWVPVLLVYGILVRRFEYFTPIPLGIYLLLGWVLGMCQAFWPCPRCGQNFSSPWQFSLRGGGYKGGIADECVHCGLPKFAADDATNDSGAVSPRFCSKCGTAVAGGAGRFCSKCGAPIAAGWGRATGTPPPL
jgi:hypothetical protein